MRAAKIIVALALLAGIVIVFIGAAYDGDSLVVYSGRSQSLVEPIIEQFEEETGIRVQVKYGATPQLAMTLREEGERSPADVFWAQEVSALEALDEEGFFSALPGHVFEDGNPAVRHAEDHWAATSGRARVLAFNTDMVSADELPGDVRELTDSQWEGRVGWAPSNGSFQAFVTGMRLIHGEEATGEWVEGMRDNGAMAYANNTAIVEALGAGEIAAGLTNHYYLLRFKEDDPDFPVDQVFFDAGDPANLVMYAGIGALRSASHEEAAHQFIRFLLGEDAQDYFTNEVYECSRKRGPARSSSPTTRRRP
ncbi:MAG: extracellular solute-binding protein [Candidatus Hydrogenedentota bacterium]